MKTAKEIVDLIDLMQDEPLTASDRESCKKRFAEMITEFANEQIGIIRDKDVEEIVETVHFNACMATMEACIEQWGVDIKEENCPPHPPIDRIKK